MTQKELADLIKTTQSVVSYLEDANYSGNSVSMLSRIASIFNKRLTLQMTTEEETCLSRIDRIN